MWVYLEELNWQLKEHGLAIRKKTEVLVVERDDRLENNIIFNYEYH